MRSQAPPIIVYVVDDDPAVRQGFARLLRSAGLEARCSEDAESFLAGVQNQDNACVLLDVTMPRMTGPQVQAELAARGITLPVISISARDDEHARACAHVLGARLFLRKPVDDQALIDAIAWVTGTAG